MSESELEGDRRPRAPQTASAPLRPFSSFDHNLKVITDRDTGGPHVPSHPTSSPVCPALRQVSGLQQVPRSSRKPCESQLEKSPDKHRSYSHSRSPGRGRSEAWERGSRLPPQRSHWGSLSPFCLRPVSSRGRLVGPRACAALSAARVPLRGRAIWSTGRWNAGAKPRLWSALQAFCFEGSGSTPTGDTRSRDGSGAQLPGPQRPPSVADPLVPTETLRDLRPW